MNTKPLTDEEISHIVHRCKALPPGATLQDIVGHRLDFMEVMACLVRDVERYLRWRDETLGRP